MKNVFIGMTGASGIIYAKKLINVLADKGYNILLAGTENALLNASAEDNFEYADIDEFISINNLHVDNIYDIDDLASNVSSGSNKIDYTFIVPASMGYVARVATGISSNLIERVTDVAFKERRKIAILFRELPLSKIHLKNLLTVSDNGAVVIPLAPAFYHQPKNIDDITNFVIGKALDVFEIENNLYKRWLD